MIGWEMGNNKEVLCMSFIDTSEQKDKIEVRKQMNQMISEAKKVQSQ